MREHRSKSGALVYFATRAELEHLKGYRGNDRRGRACCPIHGGDNPTALMIDWETGWARCYACGDAWAIRVEDHPDAWKSGNDSKRSHTMNPPQSQEKRYSEARSDPQGIPHSSDALRDGLLRAVATAAEALPSSPGAAYLAERGIPIDVACELGIGWGTRGALAGRVVFPLSGPDGIPTSATARRIYETENQRDPKYRALDRKAGYVKTLFNGGAIGHARQSGHPLIVVEGPLDAAACVAAGLPLVVAIGSTSYAYPDHFAGLATVILALDADKAGQDGRRALWLELVPRGIDVLLLPADALEGCKDLGEYWQQHHAMPPQLVARSIGPHQLPARRAPRPAAPASMLGASDDPSIASPIASADDTARNAPHAQHLAGPAYLDAGEVDLSGLPTREEIKRRAEEAHRVLALSVDDLSAALWAEAEALTLELVANPSDVAAFLADLLRNEHMLGAEDRWAAWQALKNAMATSPDDSLALDNVA
jgi:hypothetical protein